MTRFLFWVAGADETKMRGLRKERVYYQLVGGSVLLTAVAAVVGMLMFQRLSVPGNWIRDVAIALLWGTFIFWIDRWLVSYVDYGPLDGTNTGEEVRGRGWSAGFVARILLGLLLAFVISGPIVLSVFEPEVEQRVIVNQNTARSAGGAQIAARADFVERAAAIDAAVARAEQTAKDKETALQAASQAVDDEQSGRGGTFVPGCGDRCEDKKQELRAADAEAVTARAAAQAAREKATADRAALKGDIDAAVAENDAGIAAGVGILARERALFDVLRAEPYLLARWASLSALLLLIDMMPILMKIAGSRRRLHDHVTRWQAADEAIQVQRERVLHEQRGVAAVEIEQQAIDERTKLRKETDLLDSEIVGETARSHATLHHEWHQKWLDLARLGQEQAFQLQAYELRARHAAAMAEVVRRYGHLFPDDDQVQRPDPASPPLPPGFAGRGGERLVNNRWALMGPIPQADRGGSGQVHVARDIREPGGDLRVVKLIPPESDPAARRRALRHLLNEQKWARKAGSAFVAPILDAGDDAHYGPFLVTPLYPSTLSRTLAAAGFQPSLAFAVRVVKQALRGLCDCYRGAGMVHLDIKPANIALDGGGDVLLIDFGIARAIVAITGPLSGPPDATKWYASPEQLRGELQQPWLSESDVRAVCAVFYEVLTGRPPLHYEAWKSGMLLQSGRENMARAGDLYQMLLTEVPIEPITMLPWLPRELSDFIMRGLQIGPKGRAPGRHLGAVENALDDLVDIERRIPRDLLARYVGEREIEPPDWPPPGRPLGPSPGPAGPPPGRWAGPPPRTQSTAAEGQEGTT